MGITNLGATALAMTILASFIFGPRCQNQDISTEAIVLRQTAPIPKEPLFGGLRRRRRETFLSYMQPIVGFSRI